MRRVLTLLPIVACLSACIDIPQAPKRESVRSSTRTFSPRPETRQCLSQLGVSRASFTPLPDRYFGAGCSNIGTVRLDALATDDARMTLGNMGPVTCTMADDFAAWARFGVNRAAVQILGAEVVRIETFGSYSCRNVAGSSRRSGHATANAIDVSAFILADGRRVSVLDDWSDGSSAERKFLRAVHASACKRFGTTLGPEYNAAHRNHFHLEADGGRFCQ